ncbi:MAG: HAMP domain-containing sensor histidine kinase [Myxococcales bacterium]
MHDRPVGVLCLGRKGPFTEEAIAFAQAAARPLSLSLQNAMLHRDVERLALELQEANERLQERNAQLEERTAEIEDANAQLRHQADALSSQGRRQTEFLAAVAHELRNPLAVISSATRLLEEGAGSRDSRERAPAVIRRQSSLLSRMVDDLLDAARVGRGQLTLERRPLDLVELARHAAEAAAPAMRQKNHQLELDLPPASVWVDADAVRIQQVLGNLLHNAAKYTDPGGHVKLQVRREADDAVVRVSDDGIGLAPEALAGVFELFMQVDRTGSRAQGGLGIGLALVRDSGRTPRRDRGGQERRAGPGQRVRAAAAGTRTARRGHASHARPRGPAALAQGDRARRRRGHGGVDGGAGPRLGPPGAGLPPAAPGARGGAEGFRRRSSSPTSGCRATWTGTRWRESCARSSPWRPTPCSSR